MDVLGRAGKEQLLILLPEVGAEAAGAVVARLVRERGNWRAGFACYPSDGCEVDSLLAGARSAAGTATTGQAATVAQTFKRLRVGDTTVAVADPAMLRLYALVGRLAKADVPVLILGETGTGKELAATALHHGRAARARRSSRSTAPRCPSTLIESELFGHEKGAFTGAVAQQAGPARAAPRGHAVPRRGGRAAAGCRPSSCACSSAQTLQPAWGARETQARRARRRGDPPRPRGHGEAGRFREDLYYRLGGAGS